jgi:transposase-like protein
LINNPIVIGGPNTTVEIDESLFTRRKNCVGRVLPQQCVFGGICRQTGECFMFTVPGRMAATLLPIISTNILPATTIMSDQWRARTKVRNLDVFDTILADIMFFWPPA